MTEQTIEPADALHWGFLGVLSDFAHHDDLSVNAELKIRSMKQDEFDILTDMIANGDWHDYDLAWLTDVLTDFPSLIFSHITTRYPKRELNHFKKRLHSTLVALRLLGRGDVRLTVIAYYPLDRDHAELGYLKTIAPPAANGTQYAFPASRKSELGQLVALLQSHLDSPIIRALRHFQRLYELDESTDQLWHCWAGLEALFWHRTRDIGFKQSALIPWRAASFASASEAVLRDSYCNPRSKTVHGSQHPASITASMVIPVENTLRESLRRAIQQPTKLDKVVQQQPLGSEYRR